MGQIKHLRELRYGDEVQIINKESPFRSAYGVVLDTDNEVAIVYLEEPEHVAPGTEEGGHGNFHESHLFGFRPEELYREARSIYHEVATPSHHQLDIHK